MALIVWTISAIPAGIVFLDMYESNNYFGPYSLLSRHAVTEGQSTIEFNATDTYYYKFKLVNGVGAESDFSSIQQYTVDTTMCTVSGRCVDITGTGIAGVTVTATLIAQTVVEDQNEQVAGSVQATTNSNGEWVLPLLRSSVMADLYSKYIIEFSGSGFTETRTVTIPDAALADYEDLPLAGSLTSDFNFSWSIDEDSSKFVVGEKKYLSVVLAEENERVTSLPGCTAEMKLITIVSNVETITFDWSACEIEGMVLRRLYDFDSEEIGTYKLYTRVTSPNGEIIRTHKPFKITLKV